MPGREGSNWRLAPAALAIIAMIVAVGFALRSAGLGAAANVVQVLSGLSLIGAVATWARARRGGPGRVVSRSVALPELLRSLAEAHDVSVAEIQAALPGWDAAAFLAGTSLPDWDFLVAFLALISRGDQAIRDSLMPPVRLAWEATRDQLGGPDAAAEAVPSVLVQVTTGAGRVLTVSEQAAAASQAAGRMQESATQLEALRRMLTAALRGYATALAQLRAERDKLAAGVAAQQDRLRQQESRHAAETTRLAAELDSVRERLSQAELLARQTRQRLDEAERKLTAAARLREEARSQATRYRREARRMSPCASRRRSSGGCGRDCARFPARFPAGSRPVT
jgi:hypothetical protein